MSYPSCILCGFSLARAVRYHELSTQKGATLETLAGIAAALGMTLSERFLDVDQPLPEELDRLSTALAGQSRERQRTLLQIPEEALRLGAQR